MTMHPTARPCSSYNVGGTGSAQASALVYSETHDRAARCTTVHHLESSFCCRSDLSSENAKTCVTFKPLTRLTSRFFLHACKFTFYHINLKSYIRIKEILNFRAFDILSLSNYLTRSCIYQHNLFI
ncbi:hypothetical protein Hanom_Chr04g00349091 [Helianthus anomalus]